MQEFKRNVVFRSFFQKLLLRSEKQKDMTLFSLRYSKKKGDIEETLFFNFPFDKGRLKNIVCWFFEKHGQYKTLKFLEKLKEVGFGSATTAGISLGIDDLKIPSQKIALVSTAETKVAKDLVQYRNAKITGIERVQRLIYTWNQTNDTLKQEVVRLFETNDLFNPIYMMAFSGARGNMSQVRQLVGMRGLMSDPQGQIIDFPIQSNFREGLTLTEYLISTYGARKGIVDTALRTATAGYLTRRLVDVAQHTIVSKFDCGTMRGIFLFDMKDGKKTIYSFQNRLIGRVLAQNIEFFDKTNEKGEAHLLPTPVGGKEQLAFRNQEIDSKLAQAISNVTKKAFVRSPLTCETSRFVCQLCYGWSLSHGKLVSIGEAVGIIAAQSIGEPGTQLTMRTFHTGGVFAGGLTDQILAPFDGKIKYLKNIPGTCVRNALSEIAFFTKMPGSFLIEKPLLFFENKKQDPSLFVHPSSSKGKKGEIFKIPAYALLFCRNNEFVRKKQVLAQFSSVLKKMQYGRAEQTLYSTLAGEFVFGKSFFFQQQSKIFPNSLFLQSESKLGSSQNFATHQNLEISSYEQKRQHFGFSAKQFLLLEKRRKGDFSEVELKNDILWKSQNWTTVWILSGKVFRDFLNTNFPFQEGDFLKKTSILQRILWTKNKNYHYFLNGSQKVQEKRKKNQDYFFAFEKKKIHDSFFSHFSFFENLPFQFFKNFSKKKTVINGHKDSGIQNIQINLNVQFLLNKRKKNLIFNSFEKTFLISEANMKKIFFSFNFLLVKKSQNFSLDGNGQSQVLPRQHRFKLFFDTQKKNDFLFIQNKSTRFFNDFQKNSKNSLTFLEKNRNLSSSFFSKDKTRKPESSRFQKNLKKAGTSLFFKFLNKRKNFVFPFFLNFVTFSKIFHISQKFGLFSFFFNDFYETSFIQSRFLFLQKKSKNMIFSSSMSVLSFGNFSRSLFVQNQQLSSFSRFLQKRKEKKKISLNTSLFLKEHPKNQKKKKYKHTFSQKRNKNIVCKKFFLRLPVEKMYYKKFAYFVVLSAKGEKKKLKSSFQTFSTLMKKENLQAEQRNIGKAEPLFIESQNFYGKNGPNSFSNCFFENSQMNTGGIFSSCFFEHHSKKQRIFYFCEKFLEHDKNKILCLKPKNVQKMYLLNDKKQQIPFFSLKKEGNFFQVSNFSCLKDSRKKLKNFSLSMDILFLRSPVCIFQVPTFSFLSILTNSFLKAFPVPSNFLKKQKFLQSLDNTKNVQNKNQFQNSFFREKEDESFFMPVISNEKKINAASLFFTFSENGNGKNFSKNTTNSKFSLETSQFLLPYSKPSIGEKSFGNLFLKFREKQNSFQTIFFQPLFQIPKEKQTTQRKIENLFRQYKRRKNQKNIAFFDFSKEKSQEDEKRKAFWFYNFSLNKFHLISTMFYGEANQNKKEKSFSCDDFYTQEIFWLPQENCMIFTSDISICLAGKNISNLSSFYSYSSKNPFLFFTNRQGKKKIFSFFPHGFSDTFHSQKKKKPKAFEGLLRISKKREYQTSSLFGLKTNKKGKTFFPLHQKFSCFSKTQKQKSRPSDTLNQKTGAFSNRNRQMDKTKTSLFDQFLIKSIALKFQKRSGNKKFKNIQQIFSKKIVFFQSLSSNKFEKKCLPSAQTQFTWSKFFHFGKKNMTLFDKHSKNSYFFAKKVQNQCFTCLPFQKNPSTAVSFHTPPRQTFSRELIQNALLLVQRKLNSKRKNFSEKKKKLQFKVDQGWLVLPFSHSPSGNGTSISREDTVVVRRSNKIFFKDHKRIEKKGHFFDKNITFEQNIVFVETILFNNSCFSFSNSETNFFLKTEKYFQMNFLQTNPKCRYISFSSFQNKRKENSNCSQIFYSFEKKQAVQFPNVFSPIHTMLGQYPSRFLSSAQQMQKRKKFTIMQFFRPFQYKIVQNPQNAKKFLRDIRFQYFSKRIFSSCLQFYKKYHSSFFNLQKKEKRFLDFSPNIQSKKKKNFKFEVQSNFQNLYFSNQKISFLSFDFLHERENIVCFAKKMQKNFEFQEKEEMLQKAEEFQKYFQKQLSFDQKIKIQSTIPILKENLEFSNTVFPAFSQTFGGNTQKNFFFYFGKAQKEKKKFSFYPIQFLPLVLSLSNSHPKNSFLSKNKILNQSLSHVSLFPTFSLNPFQNTIEFQLSQKRATFFDPRSGERFSFQKFFDFVPTSLFWLNKDRMNFLFSTVSKQKNFLPPCLPIPYLGEKGCSPGNKIELKKNSDCIKNSVFEKNIRFYGSTEFLSPYKGEILSMFTQNMYWWKKASEISTIQNFEKLFTIVTKKDFFSVEFPSFCDPQNLSVQNTKNSLFSSRSKESHFLKQKHLRKLYEALQMISKQKNSFLAFKDQNEKKTKTKISSFVTKYEKNIYTFQNLTIGYPSLFQKPVLGNFVVYGDNFFGSSLQKPGQIIHLSSSSMILRKGQPCLVSSNGILHFSNTPYIQKNVPLVTLPYQTVQAGDIVQGIPKVEQFFEARTTLQGRLFVSSLPILLKGIFERYKILLPLEQATRQTFLKIQQIIVDGVQRVYRSQGVSITDKHLEVVVRQMTTKVQILNGAQTGFFPGELVRLDLVERLNKFLMVKICYEPVILGITRASLEVDSFLSASSFQQTTKILSLAAISRKKDFLKGLKENLLVGNLIPSGTGYFQFSKTL